MVLLIIVLVLILAIIISVYCGVHYLKKKTKEFSSEIFGTEDIKMAAKQMKEEYSSTPKSVSSMTSLLLPKIASDFPDFHYDEMKARAENTLIQYLRAISDNDKSILTEGNEELKLKLENYMKMLSVKDLHEHFEQIHIHRTEINKYRKAAGRCIITFQSALQCFHYITKADKNLTEGSKKYTYQTKFNIDLIYIQDRNLVENELDNALGVNCPNCGTPLTSLGAKVCEYCSTPVIEINIHAWSFSDIEEVK